MNLFFLTIFGVYLLLMIALIIGWQEAFLRKPPSELAPSFHRKISVIVPFRNEEKFLPILIRDLQAQNLPPEHIEIIAVDDHSSDQSANLLRQANQGNIPFRLLSLPADKMGKKQALNHGIAHASGDIIVTTDADCRVKIDWLSSIQRPFDDPVIMMVFGGVRMVEKADFFSKLQALEFCSLIGTAAASAALGFPTMCNGANLAFRKAAFVEVKGYEDNFHVLSGDDEFLMRKIDQRYAGSVCFLADDAGINETNPLPTRDAFIQQRLRWAGKWSFNSSFIAKYLAVFIFVFQGSFLAIWFAPLVGLIDWWFALVFVLFKMAFDLLFLLLVSRFLKVTWKGSHFFALQFVYPVYVVYVGIASFIQPYEWKGRGL
jgi:cellulose synthase/poly-beta-1,6-N-acetylglucosamine synthase-like glycosyltransferase